MWVPSLVLNSNYISAVNNNDDNNNNNYNTEVIGRTVTCLHTRNNKI